jgi:uncharacterized protein YaiI (UPF0178 family)
VTRKKKKKERRIVSFFLRALSLNPVSVLFFTRKNRKYPWSCIGGVWYTFSVKIFIDADGAPWRDLVIERGRRHGVRVVIVADYSHDIPPEEGVERVEVDGGADAADFAIVNRVHAGDLVITQDVGLASLVLPQGVAVISPRGYEFTEGSMDGRLARRWLHGRIRKGGGRVAGPPALSEDDRERFLMLLDTKIIASIRGEEGG